MVLFSSRLFHHVVALSWVPTIIILNTNAVVVVADRGNVVRLNRDNYDELTHSRTVVFVKFFAPWCGHCKKMKDDWEKLAGDLNGSVGDGDGTIVAEGVLVAEVDCTDASGGGGKALCSKLRIESFPTLRYGDPTAPEEYNGKRSYRELSAFAREHLVPMLCTPTNLGACPDDASRTAMKEYAAMSTKDLGSSIVAEEKKLESAERIFKNEVKRLTKEYQKAEETKRKDIDGVVSGGDLEFMRQTIAMLKKEHERHQKEADKKRINSDEL
mmetsp:Transcript_20503/g.46530  ORF Transcript_20503/g.46530 Transcript_20503/m.46530 type:complete len:270 (-) Transcript_20503:38-847(-)